MKSIAFVIPYFGKFPNYFSLWLQSCRNNPTIDWLLFTDSNEKYDYPKFHLSMDCFYAKVFSGGLVLKEHEAAKWLSKSELGNVEWLPADKMIIEKIKK